MLEALVGPISLRTVSLSPPSCSSKTSLSLFRPAHLRNEALSMESISTRKKEIAWWSLRAAPAIGAPCGYTYSQLQFISFQAGCPGGSRKCAQGLRNRPPIRRSEEHTSELQSRQYL